MAKLATARATLGLGLLVTAIGPAAAATLAAPALPSGGAVDGDPVWRQTSASRYVRLFQSRRSLLIWKVIGARLDGWTNADHPTESVPGDAGTLPPGAQANQADLDFVASPAHPAGVGVPGMTIDEKMAFARWVDLGCPINTGEGTADENFG